MIAAKSRFNNSLIEYSENRLVNDVLLRKTIVLPCNKPFCFCGLHVRRLVVVPSGTSRFLSIYPASPPRVPRCHEVYDPLFVFHFFHPGFFFHSDFQSLHHLFPLPSSPRFLPAFCYQASRSLPLS